MNHCSTVEERIGIVAQMLGTPKHGLVSQLSQTYQVSRQTLYRWADHSKQALRNTLGSEVKPVKAQQKVESMVLSLLIENQSSYRKIQTGLKSQHGLHLSLGKIVQIVQDAGQRARAWLESQRADQPRALALDEQYGSQRGHAYLNVIDVHSGQVWMTIPPVHVDGESWTLVLWYLHEQGIHSSCTVSDGGKPIQDGVKQTTGLANHQRDVWHLFQLSAKIQGRLESRVKDEETRLGIALRHEARKKEGKGVTGRPVKRSLSEQQEQTVLAKRVAEGVRYLTQEIRTLLEVVVLGNGRILSLQERIGELDAALELLEELAHLGLREAKKEIELLVEQFRRALPHLVVFAHALEPIQQEVARELSPDVLAFLGWAWLRRRWLAKDTTELLAGLASAWQPAARKLFSAWEQAVRASSAVENWHSVVRPHLAAHRRLSANVLALLAVYHNHQIAPRGVHQGLSPLQRTNPTTPAVHWLAALGYPPLAA